MSSQPSTSQASKNLFQIDYSFIGNNKFKKRVLSRAPIDPEASEDSQYVKTSVYCVRLNRLIKTENKNARDIIKKKFKIERTRDLIHTICALYDNSLPDIGPQSIYDCVCSPKSFTICVLKEDDTELPDEDSQSLYGSNDDLKAIENQREEPDSIFSNLFSDEEDDDESDSDFSKKVDFTHGLKTFLKDCKNGPRKPLLKNLIAVATIQKTSTYQLPGQDEWVIDLELMSVRPKYRGLSIGKYLINLIQNKNYVGNFDAIVTSSDIEAIKFYEKYGFNIDPILNSKYKFIGDIWTNTTKMCYVPPYCQLIDKHQAKLKEAFSHFSQKPVIKSIEMLDLDDEEDPDSEPENFENICVTELTNMETDFKKWQKLMFSAYQNQAQLFFKLKQEVTNLKIKLSAKESIIDDLKFQNDMISKKNNLLKMKLGKSLEIDDDDLKFTDAEIEATELEPEESESDLDKLIADLKILSTKKTY